jgi:uncharacterized tellurite resistance protein B-like protein
MALTTYLIKDRRTIMANFPLIPALAKTLIAIAWADGDLHVEEETTLKEVLGLLPPMTAQDWGALEMYLVFPITPEEREELLKHLKSEIRTAADKQLALEAVDGMLRADGVIEPGEEGVARHIRAAISAVDTSPLGVRVRRLGGTSKSKPSREQALELWRVNPVAFVLRMQHQSAPSATGNDPMTIAALAAGIMTQVAYASPAGLDAERLVMSQALAADWRVSPAQAEVVVDAALIVARREIDVFRLSSELVERTSEDQRIRLLDNLFAIANAAEHVAQSEIDEIGVIAKRLNLSSQYFIDAKLKIAPEDRRGL